MNSDSFFKLLLLSSVIAGLASGYFIYTSGGNLKPGGPNDHLKAIKNTSIGTLIHNDGPKTEVFKFLYNKKTDKVYCLSSTAFAKNEQRELSLPCDISSTDIAEEDKQHTQVYYLPAKIYNGNQWRK